MTPRHKLRIATMIAALAGLSLAISALPGAAAAPPAASLMRAEFTWYGTDLTDNWVAGCNWHDNPVCQFSDPFPDDTGDNATFPWNASGAWNCKLGTEGIGDLTIAGSVDFNTAGGAVTLTAGRLFIEPTSGDIEITMTGTAKIVVD